MFLIIFLVLVIFLIIFMNKINFIQKIVVPKKKYFIIIGLIIVLVVLIIVVRRVIIRDRDRYRNTVIEDNYFAKFSIGGGEIVYNTYLYIEDGKYKYIQSTSMTSSWGSGNWNESVTNVGETKNFQDIIDLVKRDDFNVWVRLNVDVSNYHKGDTITIEELKELLEL